MLYTKASSNYRSNSPLSEISNRSPIFHSSILPFSYRSAEAISYEPTTEKISKKSEYTQEKFEINNKIQLEEAPHKQNKKKELYLILYNQLYSFA